MTSDRLMIELTTAEQELLGQINLEARPSSGHEAVRRNGALVAALMALLIARNGAIPAHRVRYFRDPDYNIGGRGSSRQDRFERNGTAGEAIFRHPHFLKHFRYFIYGPDLPAPVQAAFADSIRECGPITSGDIDPLSKFARELTRRHRIGPKDAAEEFFKLALEHGLSADHARSIRDSVRTVRTN